MHRPIPPPVPRLDGSSTAALPAVVLLRCAPHDPVLRFAPAAGPAWPADRRAAVLSIPAVAIAPALLAPPQSTDDSCGARPGSTPGAATDFSPACESPPAFAGAATTAAHRASASSVPTIGESARPAADPECAWHRDDRSSVAAPPTVVSSPHPRSTTDAPSPPASARTIANCLPLPSPPAPSVPGGLDRNAVP